MSKNQVDNYAADEKIRLKPIAGVLPSKYIFGIYLLLFFLILFIILIFPGLLKNGSFIYFHTFPNEAEIKIDNHFTGVTPCGILLKNGNHEIEISKPLYKTQKFDIKVDFNIFGSFFKKNDREYTRKLTLTDDNLFIENALNEFCRFGMYQHFSYDKFIPPILSETSISLLLNNNEIKQNQLYDFLHNAMYYVDSRFEIKDFLLAYSTLVSNGKIFSIKALLSLISEYNKLHKLYSGFPFWIEVSLHYPNSELDSITDFILNSGWYQMKSDKYWSDVNKKNINKINFHPNKEIIPVKGINFCKIPESTVMLGNRSELSFLLHPKYLNEFYISQNEITNKQFYDFVIENPEWNKSNLQELMEKHKVTSDYLINSPGNTPESSNINYPITNISWYAAKAYCKWLTDTIQDEFEGYQIRLVSATEFEYMAQMYPAGIPYNAVFSDFIGKISLTGNSEENLFGVKDIFGNAAEWCENGYLPCEYTLFSICEGYDAYHLQDSEKIIKGGSWINDRNRIFPYTRGAQPPDWCTPYLGFRIVMTKE